MQRYFAFLLLMTCTDLSAQIVNPGFTSGMSGWQSTCASEAYLSGDVGPYGGTSSVAVTMLSSSQPDCYHNGDQVLPFVYQELPGLQNGSLVRLHLWSKAVPDQPANAMLMQGFYVFGWMTSPTTFERDFSNATSQGMVGGGGPLDWQAYTAVCTLSGMPPGATAVLLLGGHAFGNTNGTMLYDDVHISAGSGPSVLNAKVWLDGPYVPAQGLMRDDLRAAGYLPATEPYSNLLNDTGGGETVAPSVLAVTGNNAIVDWVRVELRFGPPYYNNGAYVAKRNALLQRDGDIVDVDGVSPVAFNVGPGNYHVVVMHRNHLPVMTASAISFSGVPIQVDFRAPATSCFLRVAPNGDLQRKTVGTTRTLWSGDVVRGFDGLKYMGSGNDRDQILNAVFGIPTHTLTGYHGADVNMDGVVKYVGMDNDRDPILVNIGGSTPTAVRMQQVPIW